MAFFQLVLKARKLEKARRRYEDEKLTSLEISKGAKPRFTFKQRLRRRKLWLKKKVKKFCSKILAVPKDSWMYKKIVAIRTDGTLENHVGKSLLGFCGGVILTYIFFIFFVFQLNFKLSSATFLCTLIGTILTLGLAFSSRVRCIVFLLLPQFFSKRGRQALMAYAFILAFTGPVKNVLHNTGVLSESLACAQEQLKEAVKTVIDLAKQPFYALREAISKVIKTVKAVVKKIKQTLIAIKRLVLSILRVITAVFQWLGSVINMCNKKLGTPFDRCQSVFDGAIADCKAKLGPILGVVCNITYIVSALCYVVKPLDFICMLVSYIADSVVGVVRSKVKKFTMHMKTMFYVKVKFSHSFHFETNQSKTVEQVSTSIATEIRSRTDKLFGFFDWMSFVTSFFVIFILLRVLRYRYKWLTSERFDNRYITEDLRTIDLLRARQDKETVLPLNSRERNKYAPLSSVKLIKSERIKLARSMIFLSLGTIKLVAYMAIDYSLYWVLNTIQLHGRFQSKVERPNIVTIHVAGEGYLSDLYRSIVKAFTPHGKETEIDTMLCLPDPIFPDLDKYTQIVTLVIFCWLITIFEPYGLRLRHVVMRQYYPDRAKQRAAWLYNHIIRTRGSFLKFARRQLRRKFGVTKGEKADKVTLREKLWAVCPLLNVLFPLKQNACLLCGDIERSEGNPHVKCPTPGCIGLFCTQCFADLQNLCTICRSPMEYGDLSDMSEEKDSSEDQFEVPREKIAKPEEAIEEPEVVEEEEKEEEIPEDGEEEIPEGEEEEMIERDKETEEEEAELPVEGEKMPEVEEAVKTEIDVAEQTDDKYVEEDLDRSTDSTYSYTYQDESPEEIEVEKRKEPFRDVEAQKIRDDVTIQIFNEPLVREVSSSSESPTSCFVVRARRKIRAKLKKRPCGPGVKDSDLSSSIADTESCSSEQVDEDEVIHIEVDDGSEELLPKDRKDKGKLGRINRIVGAVARIPWLGKGEDDGRTCSRGLQRRRPSLMSKIVSMLQRKQSTPVQTYKRTRKIRDSTSSSCSCDEDDENESLLKIQDRETDCRYLTRRKSRRARMEDESDENLNRRVPREKRFATKRMPKYLECTARSTSYFEEDETESSRGRKSAGRVEDINELSDMKASSRARKKDTWNITEDDELGFCTCTSEITFETIGERDSYSLGMSTISERTDSTSKSVNDEMEIEKEAKPSRTIFKPPKNAKDDTSEYEESKYSGETQEEKTELEEDVKENRKSKEISVKEKETPKDIDLKEKRISKEVSAKDVRKWSTPKEVEEVTTTAEETETQPQEESVTFYTDTDSSPKHDPLAGLELYDDTPVPRKKFVPWKRQVIAKKEAAQSKVQRSEEEDRVLGGNLGTSEQIPRVSGENSRNLLGTNLDSEQIPRVSGGNPRNSEQIPRASEGNPRNPFGTNPNSEQVPRISGENPRISTQIPRVSRENNRNPFGTNFNSKQIPRVSEGNSRNSERISRIPGENPRNPVGTNPNSEQISTVPAGNPRNSEQISRVSGENSRNPFGTNSNSQKIPRVSGGNPRISQEQISKVSEEKRIDLDNTNGKTFVDSRTANRKFDKATDLPDKSRSTQTKFHKRDTKDKHAVKDTKIAGERKSSKLSQRFIKGTKKEKKGFMQTYWKKCKEDRDKRAASKRKKCSCSEKSTLTEDEEIYLAECGSKRSRRSDELIPGTSTKQRKESEERKPCENVYSAHECECDLQSYDTDFYRTFAYETPHEMIASDYPETMTQRFEMPTIKRYLPMYQNPELIEELKMHDRVKLIREKEERRRIVSSFQSLDSISPCSNKTYDRRIDRSVAPSRSSRVIEQDDRLPYQETQAYADLLREFQRRRNVMRCRESFKKSNECVPLINLSREADKSKEVEQLYLRQKPSRRRTDVLKKFANKIVAPFKPIECKRHQCKMQAKSRNFEEAATTSYDYSYEPEIYSEISSRCTCAKRAQKSRILTSADETTDNNESTQ